MKKLILVAGILMAISVIRSAFVSGPTNNNTILLACGALALGLYGWFFDKLKKMRWLTITIIALAISFLGLTSFIAVYGRRVTADYTEDVVLVLGGGIRQGEIMPVLQMRLDQTLAYHQQNPDAIILVTGGTGFGETFSEAEAMAEYLIARGVPREQILIEDAAVSTYTNMTLSLEMLEYYFDEPLRAVIITSDFHMFRSEAFAHRLGIDATVYPASTPLRGTPFYYVREVAAVIKMWIIGT